jgi:diaminohydroxyphosphoribosylaminopyrimidine deaminase/5-amino-6-(5-phosphoribosylamino)uracil reductase
VLDHNYWMRAAMELASKGMALAHPNPLVGAVVVMNGIMVGHGFHVYDRLDHAEIGALKEAGPKARGATLYVNLEPCCHAGRTGPCTKAIIAAGIKKVYGAMKDPNPAVAGRGIAQLRRAGIQVALGAGEENARELNEDFAKWIRTGLPFVTLKSALTLDGKIAERAGSSTRISGAESREEVQRMRHAADALLTGIGTVLTDNPRLTDRTREPRRRTLLRAVVDSRLRLPLRSKLVKSAQDDVVVFTTVSADRRKEKALNRAGVEVFRVPANRGRVDLHEVVRELGKRQMLNVLLETGSELNGATLAAGIVDKVVLFYAPRIMGASGVPFAVTPSPRLQTAPGLANVALRRYGPDIAVQGYIHDVYRNH